MPRRSPSVLLVHVVWATAGRRRILEPLFDDVLLGILIGRARELGCAVLCGGCAPDHVHVIVELAARVPLAELVQKLKGGGAYDANRHPLSPRRIAWQQGYWAESLGPGDLFPLSRYVKSQRAHHDLSHPAERWQFSS
jgi:REP element-mobilizing transposase RayT